MEIDIITAFPDFFKSPFDTSLIKRAREEKIITLRIHDLRDYASDKHRQIDDYPFGGGPGMILKPEPLFEAVSYVKTKYGNGHVIYPSPDGKQFSQEMSHRLVEMSHLTFICGHYKGIDERVRVKLVDEEISVGDYILSGGEIPALMISDSVLRLVPGVIGNKNSAASDSFENGLLDHPHYTRPAEFKGMKIPEVLRSGNHKEIEKWRIKNSLEKTRERRKDLPGITHNTTVTDKES